MSKHQSMSRDDSCKKKGRTQCECSHVMWGLGKGHGCYLAALPLILGQLTKVIRPLKVNE